MISQNLGALEGFVHSPVEFLPSSTNVWVFLTSWNAWPMANATFRAATIAASIPPTSLIASAILYWLSSTCSVVPLSSHDFFRSDRAKLLVARRALGDVGIRLASYQ